MIWMSLLISQAYPSLPPMNLTFIRDKFEPQVELSAMDKRELHRLAQLHDQRFMGEVNRLVVRAFRSQEEPSHAQLEVGHLQGHSLVEAR